MSDFFRYLAAWLDGCGWGHDEFLEGYEMGMAQAEDLRLIAEGRAEKDEVSWDDLKAELDAP